MDTKYGRVWEEIRDQKMGTTQNTNEDDDQEMATENNNEMEDMAVQRRRGRGRGRVVVAGRSPCMPYVLFMCPDCLWCTDVTREPFTSGYSMCKECVEAWQESERYLSNYRDSAENERHEQVWKTVTDQPWKYCEPAWSATTKGEDKGHPVWVKVETMKHVLRIVQELIRRIEAGEKEQWEGEEETMRMEEEPEQEQQWMYSLRCMQHLAKKYIQTTVRVINGGECGSMHETATVCEGYAIKRLQKYIVENPGEHAEAIERSKFRFPQILEDSYELTVDEEDNPRPEYEEMHKTYGPWINAFFNEGVEPEEIGFMPSEIPEHPSHYCGKCEAADYLAVCELLRREMPRYPGGIN